GCDGLVAMNDAAISKNQFKLKPNGIVIANTEGFNAKNLRLAKVENNPIDEVRKHAKVYEIAITQQTNEALKDSELGTQDKDRTKTMFALGFVYWLYRRPLDFPIDLLKNQFG
ncbi:2-oxoacid:acceptor oxidoreductase family protein, partial [Ornithobacterium rhinotracheale]